MRPLTAQELLDVWERGRLASPAERALLCLAHACPESSWDALAELPIGERDGRLLTLREWMFGSAFTSIAVCPACGERLEVGFSVTDVRVASPALPSGTLSVEAGGYEVTFRLPNTADVESSRDQKDARGHLLARCVDVARRNGRKRSIRQLPAAVIDAVVERMSEADPQADVRTTLSCVVCGHGWQAVFDIASFFWSEVEDWALRTLRDVHTLASRYGWREADILSMSSWRRQCYLQLANR